MQNEHSYAVILIKPDAIRDILQEMIIRDIEIDYIQQTLLKKLSFFALLQYLAMILKASDHYLHFLLIYPMVEVLLRLYSQNHKPI